jgi:hypothetical protein
MKNSAGFSLIYCLESFETSVQHDKLVRIQRYERGTTYSWTSLTDFRQGKHTKKAMIYTDIASKGLSSVSLEDFAKYFIDVDDSINEVNIIFDKIME